MFRLYLQRNCIKGNKMNQSKLELLLEEQKKLQEQHIHHYEKCQEIGKQLLKIRDQIAELKYDFEPTLENICAIEDWDSISRGQYKKYTGYLNNNHPYIYNSGTNPDTNQIAFSISEYTNTNKYVKEFEYFLTLIRPNKEGNKIVSILDRDCSEFGSYSLIDGTKIRKTTYGRQQIIEEFKSVQECLEFIYKEIV